MGVINNANSKIENVHVVYYVAEVHKQALDYKSGV